MSHYDVSLSLTFVQSHTLKETVRRTSHLREGYHAIESFEWHKQRQLALVNVTINTGRECNT